MPEGHTWAEVMGRAEREASGVDLEPGRVRADWLHHYGGHIGSKQSLPMNQTKLTDKVAARRSCVPTSFRRTPESHDVAARADSCAAT